MGKKKADTLAERIQAKANGGGASANIPPIDEFDMLSDPEFLDKLELKRKLDIAKRYCEAKLAILNPEIEVGLIASDITAVAWDGCVLKQSNGRTADKVSVTRLVELGVALDIITRATEEGKPYTYAQIVIPKDKQQPIRTFAELEALLPEGYDGR